MNSIELYFYADAACTQPDPAGLFFRGGKNAENADSSVVVKQGYVRYGARWGAATFRVVASATPTQPLGENDPAYDYYPLPRGTRFVTVEGSRDNAGVVAAADLLQQAL